jgi:1,2-diacylglycerol 3-alpha-glucosyltransferase
MNDYVRVPYANGSSFASQFLYREFQRRGSEVTIIGPRDPDAKAEELPPRHVSLSSVPFRLHPGLHLPLPNREGLQQMVDANLSLVVAQTGSAFLEAGLWLRRNHRVPLVCVNTIHLPSVYDVLLPEALHKNRFADALFLDGVIPWVEGRVADVYNNSDGLVVLSEGMRRHWEERGVTVPIHVIPRSVEPKIFDQRPTHDPFPAWARRGSRLLVICRHTREKNVVRLLEIFAKEIVPNNPRATLALVGDGPDHDMFKAHARKLGVFDQCIWPGEVTLTDTPAWYRHADVFVYTSLSETYGQVVSEALWCGLPVVALDDKKGVETQIRHGLDGFLLDPEAADTNREFAARVNELLLQPDLRRRFSERAESQTRDRSDPSRCINRYEEAFALAKDHCQANLGKPSLLSRTAPVLRWTALHTLLAGLGCIRPPATMNRHRRMPPDWDLKDSGSPQTLIPPADVTPTRPRVVSVA